jgi:hypothetical protein
MSLRDEPAMLLRPHGKSCLLAPKQSRRSPGSDYGGKVSQQYSLSAIGYRLLAII